MELLEEVVVREDFEEIQEFEIKPVAYSEFQEGNIGEYKIVSVLGQGGEGAALLLEDAEGNKAVGKVYSTPLVLADDLHNGKVPKRESDLLAKLDHPQIPKMYKRFELPDGCKFITIREYFEGESLADILKDKKKLDEKKTVEIMGQVLEVLEYLHDPEKHPEINAPIIHRDIKPGNIMVTGNNEIKLIDFGVAKDHKDTLTNMDLKGTWKYIPREQLFGGDEIPSSDLFSLAITALECLYGKVPEDLMEKRFFSEPYSLPEDLEVSKDFRKILEGMLHPLSEKRYQSATEVRKLLKKKGLLGDEVEESKVVIEDSKKDKTFDEIRKELGKIYKNLLSIDFPQINPEKNNIQSWTEFKEKSQNLAKLEKTIMVEYLKHFIGLNDDDIEVDCLFNVYSSTKNLADFNLNDNDIDRRRALHNKFSDLFKFGIIKGEDFFNQGEEFFEYCKFRVSSLQYRGTELRIKFENKEINIIYRPPLFGRYGTSQLETSISIENYSGVPIYHYNLNIHPHNCNLTLRSLNQAMSKLTKKLKKILPEEVDKVLKKRHEKLMKRREKLDNNKLNLKNKLYLIEKKKSFTKKDYI
ncbi:MAG: serine/threonine protein kinase [Nanoarchaeota archaeon]|nr:serine/threonine protein kinase [Nanoarchaeota archaeon]